MFTAQLGGATIVARVGAYSGTVLDIHPVGAATHGHAEAHSH
ncbi:hypothetical protein [Longimicrobium sp.]|nr:hypothetical protein [Longimicrobium sp.]HEX6041558.1 hypothetical protein [Longimicrobium sp.]